MSDFVDGFNDRVQEINAYLDLLDAVDKEVQNGLPRLGAGGLVITVQQQRILYSSVYLQLYNLVEATVTKCVEAVSIAVITSKALPSDLSEKIRHEWVRFISRAYAELNYENRLAAAIGMCDHFVDGLTISEFEIEKGGGGSWDDDSIKKMTERIGFNLSLSPGVHSNINRFFRNDLRPLKFIKSHRNSLAHGSLSFAECGAGETPRELRDLANLTAIYLGEVVEAFKAYIDTREFLLQNQNTKEIS